jgi:hypothetical protein
VACQALELAEAHLLGPALLGGDGSRRITLDPLLAERGVVGRLGVFRETPRGAIGQRPCLPVPDGFPGVGAALEPVLAELEDRHCEEGLALRIAVLAEPDRSVARQIPVPIGRRVHAVVGGPPVDQVSETSLPLLGKRQHVLADGEGEKRGKGRRDDDRKHQPVERDARGPKRRILVVLGEDAQAR